jgi:hypothetical protein
LEQFSEYQIREKKGRTFLKGRKMFYAINPQ